MLKYNNMKKELKSKQSCNPFKKVPWYGWVSGVIMIFLFMGLYKIAYYLAPLMESATGGWFWNPKIDAIDGIIGINGIPFCPWFFIQIYVLAYGIWVVAPIIISTGDKKNFVNFMIYSIIAHVIGCLLLILAPSHAPRENIEAINELNPSFSKFLMQMIVGADGGNMNCNLAPSFHVLTSLLCIFGMMKRKDIHIGARVVYYVICPLIIISTVFVKQHYFMDIIVSLALGSLVYIFVMAYKPGDYIVDNYPNFLVIKKQKKQIRK